VSTVQNIQPSQGMAPAAGRFLMPLLLAISAGLALFIARRLHIDIGGLWVVISALAITRQTLPSSLTIARDQVLGTAVGALSGAVFGILREPALGLAVAVVLSTAVCNSIAVLRGVISIACAAAAIVIILPAGKPSYVTAWDRFEDCLLGAGVALVIASIASLVTRWWPRTA
jgi:uncharacterized membrane protein YgaE (UPF0421/DUF939 family)